MNWTLYCDGACSNNGYDNAVGGSAWALWKEGESKPFMKKSYHVGSSTNNICELMAAIMGCLQAVEFMGDDDHLNVYTDSAYIQRCYEEKWYKKWMSNGWVNSKKEPVANKNLWAKLIPFFMDYHFTFYKVKGHANDSRNNLVDKMAVAAKEAANERQSD